METRDVVQFIVSSIFTTVLLLFSLFHCIKSYQAFHSKSYDLNWKFNSVLCYSFILIFVAIIYCSLIVFEEVYLLINGSIGYQICSMLTTTFITTYGIFKIVMYYTLFTRLSESYKEASNLYTCSNKFYWICKIFLLITVPPYLYIVNKDIRIDDEQIKHGKCRVVIPINISVSAVTFDVIVCLINLYLFTHPLRKLSTNSVQENGNQGAAAAISTPFRKLIKKNAMLASVTILSKIATWIMIAILQHIMHIPVTWQAMDQTISCFCIILLFKWNEALFDAVCCEKCNNETPTESELEMMHKASRKILAKPKISLTPISVSHSTVDFEVDGNEPIKQTETEVP